MNHPVILMLNVITAHTINLSHHRAQGSHDAALGLHDIIASAKNSLYANY